MKAGRNAVADVKAGYKRTEVGVIPEDWDVQSLKNISKKIMVGIASAATHAYCENGIPLFRNQNIKTGYLDDSELLYIDPGYEITFKNKRLKCGDLLTARTGYPGTTCVVPPAYESAQSFTTLITRPNNQIIDSFFLCVFISSSRGQTFFEQNQIGGAQKNVNAGTLKNMPVLIPPLAEQHAIATALSDADARITSLDQLIAKKRDIRQAAMQELLTGKRRLPGFKDEWDILKMSEKSTLKARIGWQGLTTAEYLESGDYYLVTGTDFQEGRIDWSSCCFVDESRYIQDKNIQLKTGDILLTKDGTIGKVGYVDSLPGPATLNSGVFVIRPKNGAYDPQYFYYVLISRIFEVFLTKLQAGSTIIHLYQKDFVNFEFLAPEISEQRAIATVLSDMDAELAALEQQHDKMKNIKQGMMQELLTGRIRLV